MAETEGTVMIVDDEPSLLRMMSTYLKRLGFNVVCFGSTDQAWEYALAETGSIRLAVLDMTMPCMSTLDLAGRLLSRYPEMRLVVASGYPVELTEFERAGPGRVSFLHKPFTPEMLASQVRAEGA